MEGPCDDRHTPAHSMMEAPMDVEDGAADISVADNLFDTSVTPPNLSVGADADSHRVSLRARGQSSRLLAERECGHQL